ncbi:MAG: hypothetical protein R3Y08_04570 [Rikenellaceae bacterium]
MATKEEILGSDPQGGAISKPTPIIAPEDRVSTIPAPSKPPAEERVSKYEDLYKSLNPNPTPSQEQLDKEQKKYKRDQIFAAIGDGVSALSNLYFTSRGAPSMYSGKNNMSDRTRVTYDKLLADRKENIAAYNSGLMRAMQVDDNLNSAERSWKRQLGIDKENNDRYQESINHRNKREGIADDRYEAEQERIATNDKNTAEFRKQQLKQGNYQFNATLEANKEKEANLEKRRGESSSSKKDKVGFKSADGNQIAIDKDVLDGSMAEIYNNIVNDPKAKGLPMYEKPKTDADIENYVKKHWSSSPRATKFMLELSQYSTTDESKLNESSEEVKPYQFESVDYSAKSNKNNMGWGNKTDKSKITW